jgi:uncharacterized membrane protein
MPPEENLTTEPGPEDLAALVSNLTAAVSDLTARVARMEHTLAPLAARQQALSAEPPPQPVEVVLPTAVPAPPPPAVGPLQTMTAVADLKPQASLEDRLGSQIFNRIAIVAILIGATLFLKLAMDNHWIGPLGRVLVGLIAGAGLILWSERFRRKEFAAFSYSLKAIGSGVLYLSLWAAFQLYHLMPADAAFALMLLVTVWNAWMAWVQSSELLAAYAITGGFATPLLLSTGGNHQVFLFSYILTIDLATIVLVRLEQARAKNWSRLLLGALPATIAFFIGWFSSFYSPDQLASTSLFIALFFVAFLTVPFETVPPTQHDPAQPCHTDPITSVLLPLANAVFASVAFYSVLEDSGHHAALPWVALVFAAMYLAVMRLPQTVVARAVHLSLAVLFLTITIPLKASGRWITIGWLAEGVALLWISARLESDETGDSPADSAASAHGMLRCLSAVALMLGFFGLLFHAFWRFDAVHTAFFNARFATELAGLLALGAAAYISARAGDSEATPSKILPNWQQLAATSTVALNLVALVAGVCEIETFWQPAVSTYSAESSLQTALSISGFFMLYGAGLLAVGFWKHSPFLRWQALILLLVAILKTFLYDVRSLSQGYRVASFLGLGVLLLGVSFFYVRKSSPPSQ